MMSSNFGYLDIILLAMIAGFIILRLRNILGRRTGHEEKIYSNFSQRSFKKSETKTNTYLIGQDEKLLNSPSLIITGDVERSLFDPFGAFAINGGQYVDNQWQPTGPDDYNNVINRGRCYERKIHAEFYFKDGSSGFRTDCGLRAAASSFSRARMLLDQVD